VPLSKISATITGPKTVKPAMEVKDGKYLAAYKLDIPGTYVVDVFLNDVSLLPNPAQVVYTGTALSQLHFLSRIFTLCSGIFFFFLSLFDFILSIYIAAFVLLFHILL
jgi:hypothetical protein